MAANTPIVIVHQDSTSPDEGIVLGPSLTKITVSENPSQKVSFLKTIADETFWSFFPHCEKLVLLRTLTQLFCEEVMVRWSPLRDEKLFSKLETCATVELLAFRPLGLCFNSNLLSLCRWSVYCGGDKRWCHNPTSSKGSGRWRRTMKSEDWTNIHSVANETFNFVDLQTIFLSK